MKHLTTYLNFDGNCRQAISFYGQCLGAKLDLSPFPDSQGNPSSDPTARIMHGRLSLNDKPILMASDTPPDDTHHVGNNFSVAVECDSMEEIERLFAALGQNGRVEMPLADMFWGAHFGMFIDQFGIRWMLNFERPQQKA
jgi:PhnB protein